MPRRHDATKNTWINARRKDAESQNGFATEPQRHREISILYFVLCATVPLWLNPFLRVCVAVIHLFREDIREYDS
jgi:hypothetical protein